MMKYNNSQKIEIKKVQKKINSQELQPSQNGNNHINKEAKNPNCNQQSYNYWAGERRSNLRDSPIILIGDSMIKNIIPEKMSQRMIYKYTYPGKTAEQIATEVEKIDLHEVPSHVIIHAGTNNLPQDSSDACIESINNLCSSVQNRFAHAKIGVSGIIVRDDILVNDKIEEVNERIKELCIKRKYIFIDNSNIKLNALNGSNFILMQGALLYLHQDL